MKPDAMTERPVQYFTDEYLAHCQGMTPAQICDYLEDFRQLALGVSRPRRQAISIRIQEPLLRTFKHQAAAMGIPYQTQIQRLMEAWVRSG